jgi:hypothetical protein
MAGWNMNVILCSSGMFASGLALHQIKNDSQQTVVSESEEFLVKSIYIHASGWPHRPSM